MNYIPPPKFQTDDCGEIKCCICGDKCVLYWLNDDVWEKCHSDASCCGGHLCLLHAESILGRKITLADLAVEKYLLTARNEKNGQRRVVHCLVDTMIGAANHSNVQIPTGWCSMWSEYVGLGRTLSSQTENAPFLVRQLIAETTRHFPNFANPYAR